MTNLSKNGGRQTALDLGDSPKKGADQFDEATYRAELIAAGIPAGDAAAVAAKTANARRDALNANEYRLKLIDAGMGVDQAKQAAATAARFLATPEGRAAEAQRLDGFQSLGSIVGASLPTGAKKAAAAPKAQPKEPAIIQRTAKPGAITTPQQNKLLDVGAEIAATTQDEYGEFMSFTHAVLCQVGLPRSKTDAREFMRKSGDAWVNVQAGWLEDRKSVV